MISNRNIIYVLSAAISVVFLARIPSVLDVTQKIIKRQEAANDRLVEWKQAYEALLPVNKVWVVSFNDADDAKDLLAIYKMIDFERYGLRANADAIRQSESETVLVNGTQVGLQRVCIGVNSNDMELSAGSIQQLRAGIKEISKRIDLYMGSVEYAYKQLGDSSGEYVARISPFCVKVRTDGSGSAAR